MSEKDGAAGSSFKIGDELPDVAQKRESERLLAVWKSASRRHVSLGSACGCGIGGVNLAVQDYEQDIVDYLLAQAEKYARVDVIGFLERSAKRRYSDAWDLSELLGKLAQNTPSDDPAKTPGHPSTAPLASESIPDFLLNRLARTLDSFITQHG